MMEQRTSAQGSRRVAVIGAGIGGLAAAARLAHAGLDVTVFERHSHAGGKLRTLPSPAGPVDTGPTVLTMRPVFEELFASMGERLEDHVTLIRQPLVARHFWPDGSQLDLFDSEDASAQAIADFAGAKAQTQFRRFCARARELFDGFDGPMMQAATPSLPKLATHVLMHPRLIPKMAPHKTLAGLLDSSFDDARLAQLFGRYATYVGGSPYQSPALLSLIWQAEAAGVWVAKGGMHQLALALMNLAKARGAEFCFDAHVEHIETQKGAVRSIQLRDKSVVTADCVLFNGDPKALTTGALGSDVAHVAPQTKHAQRSLSAEVWAFAATPQGLDLAHHNVFFRAEPKPEFEALLRGERVADPTLYVCAQDRGLPEARPELERFEIIANAPPMGGWPAQEEFTRCQTRTFRTLDRFGLNFSPTPGRAALTTPSGFDRLFPASDGSLYGQSPHGTMAAFQRPTARTPVAGLYLVGGGTHPGAGVPMATLSARHAAAAILSDRISTSPSRPMATRGGISTGSRMAADAPSPSSRS
ncbi:1-hydroxycarotenoid 3,4-desaturase CrtD [Roseovarius sp. W115]|uniref:1-hydroxycarotenoid 3,4-desaturase CrtD n=2 Tax=Roseovarius rhodophyticola TaxID=3080827 RepID=A0ABZ2TCD4_9RHOB|nr:1-hydroxycarotenoid 3,4-desaturase CrtD [Roseovarius sp. W115]MDV2931097.1 phytoene desaturase family protein [Roseovarius sp. W115]